MSTLPGHPRPLYVTAGCEEVATDGIALRMRVPGRPEQRVPLARIRHVVTWRAVRWRSAALLACMEQRIPVTFTDGRGNALGYVLPARRKPSAFDDALEALFDLADGRALYDNWLRAEKNRLWRDWRRRARARGKTIESRQLEADIQRTVYRGEMLFEPPVCVREAIAGCAAAWLLRKEAALQYWDAESHSVALVDDLAGLLALAWALEQGVLGAQPDVDMHVQLTLFHRLENLLAVRIRAALQRLHRRAQGALEPWR